MIDEFIKFYLNKDVPDVIKIAFIIKFFGGKKI